MTTTRFALDQGFPMPIVRALPDYIADADLLSIREIDPRLAVFDDWRLLLALHHRKERVDGLITTDAKMLSQPQELSVLMQTKLTLVVAEGCGHDPIVATGLVLAHLGSICKKTRPDKPRSGAFGRRFAVTRSPGRAWGSSGREARRRRRRSTTQTS